MGASELDMFTKESVGQGRNWGGGGAAFGVSDLRSSVKAMAYFVFRTGAELSDVLFLLGGMGLLGWVEGLACQVNRAQTLDKNKHFLSALTTKVYNLPLINLSHPA